MNLPAPIPASLEDQLTDLFDNEISQTPPDYVCAPAGSEDDSDLVTQVWVRNGYCYVLPGGTLTITVCAPIKG